MSKKAETFTSHTRFLKDKETVFLVFQSFAQGGHFNTALRGKDAVVNLMTKHLEMNNLTSEIIFNTEKINLWAEANKSQKKQLYDDLWLPFGDKSWMTVTYNESVQDIFRVPMNLRQAKRNERLIKDGVPTFIRIYDYLNVPRPDSPQFRYTIVFTGNYRAQQKRRGEAQSGYYYLQTSEDPAVFNWLYESEKMPDALSDTWPGALQIGMSNRKFGRRIEWKDLPVKVKALIARKYIKLWKLSDVPQPKKRTAGELQTKRKNLVDRNQTRRKK